MKGIINNSNNEGPLSSVGRKGVQFYNKLGYIPYDVNVNENVARTLEYSYNDFSIWKLAKLLNRPEDEINLFKERANYYKNVFDKSTNFMRGKLKTGNFKDPLKLTLGVEHSRKEAHGIILGPFYMTLKD